MKRKFDDTVDQLIDTIGLDDLEKDEQCRKRSASRFYKIAKAASFIFSGNIYCKLL